MAQSISRKVKNTLSSSVGNLALSSGENDGELISRVWIEQVLLFSFLSASYVDLLLSASDGILLSNHL